MKWILLLVLALPTFQATAQNMGKKYEFINTVVDRIPLKSGMPYYDSSVDQNDEIGLGILFSKACKI